MGPLRCLIVDDEALARGRLKRWLVADADVELVGEAGDGMGALELIAQLRPDVALLDIEMPELNGLGGASALAPGGPAVIFVTAYDEHALKAFELSAVAYRLKPVTAERLRAALRRVRSKRSPGDMNLQALTARLGSAALRRMAVR